MAHADFRGTPTYFAVFKMIISSKNVNQNMLVLNKNKILIFPNLDIEWRSEAPQKFLALFMSKVVVLVKK